MVQMEIIIKNHGLCSQRNILAVNVPGMKAEQTVLFALKLLVRKVSRFVCQAVWVAYVEKDHGKLFLKSKNLIKCFGINKNRCFDCKDERICYADQVFQTPDNFWTKTKDGCECKWKVR